MRSSALTAAEVLRFYHAVSFSMWQFGLAGLMNCHIVIKWGIRDPTVAARLCWAYLNRARKWSGAGATDPRPQRRSARFGESFSFHYVYVHEFDSSGMHAAGRVSINPASLRSHLGQA